MNLISNFRKNIGDSNIFQFFKDKDRFLYHYTSANTAIEHILKDKQLKLGRYINTNDPKETKTWEFSIGTNKSQDLSQYNLKELSEKFTQALKHQTNLACFSLDGVLTGDHTKDIYVRGFGKSRMWAQYADNHRGVCIVFDKSAIRKAVTDQFGNGKFRLYGGPVIYNNHLITEVTNPVHGFTIDIDYLEKFGFDEYVKLHVENYHKVLFFEKVTDWSSESEFRIVVLGERNEDLFLNINGTIAGILFGANSAEKDIAEIVAMCDAKKTQFEQIIWKNCTPWYSFYRLEWIPQVPVKTGFILCF